ncbi:Cys-Gln thioester bond-forming surface protein [Planosporangium flavigriseum]|uniref:Thioester domain-containing protein n=1 Tax=Planosporangium flavigriseum TaxID=373681 RepID=A0A8J3PMC9_9ACTN|nr:thioester domain-containing protein [Planosporangium flavigriseum]NJC66414.1 Cys-Gln thioester bond-forming surface protein [Planosporangium flavigriseum]GIG74179.1 hypothetical protein Pfl04_25830 [Planosporangium flavigriseum]
MGRTSARKWGRLGAAVVLGGLLSFTAAGVAAAADAPAPVTGVAGDAGSGHKVYTNDDDFGVGLKTLKIGDQTVAAYCIDLKHGLEEGGSYQETAWEPSRVNNLDNVQWILTHSWPKVDDVTKVLAAAHVTTEGIDAEELRTLVYVGTQGAIWHFSDDINVTTPAAKAGDKKYGVIKAVYDYLVAGADKAKNVKEPGPNLTITPDSATGEVGSKLGPYAVNSSSEAKLTASGGKIVDANGAPVPAVPAGGKFWLTSDAAGKVTVDATAEGRVPTGRVFTSKTGPDQHQKIILAGEAKAESVAHAIGTFTPKAAPTLPVTGASAVGAAVGGVVLLGGGGVLVAMLRRRRVTFTA